MVCPYCHQKTKVSNSRRHRIGFSVWRRRHCQGCKNTFTTLEHILTESTITFKDADGSLHPLRRLDIYISVYNALGGSQDVTEAAEQLTLTCIDKLFSEKTPILNRRLIEKHIFETLSAYQPLSGQRYLLNELQRTKI